MLYWGCKAGKRQANFNFAGICHKGVESIAKAMADVKSRDALLAHTKALDRILTWQFYAIPLFYSPVDRIAYWRDIAHPDTTPLYGPVLETWWHSPE
jgi:microcin C transport system substrate-binding protein